jgi:hypothetical protein
MPRWKLQTESVWDVLVQQYPHDAIRS